MTKWKPPKRDHGNTILNVRIRRPESERFWELMDEVKARTPYTPKSAVVREIIGLDPPTHLTPADLEYIRTGKPRKRAKTKQSEP